MAAGSPYGSLAALKLAAARASFRGGLLPRQLRDRAPTPLGGPLQSPEPAAQGRVLQGRVPTACARAGPEGGAASFPVEVDLSAASFEPRGGRTSISRALKNERALCAPGEGRAPRPARGSCPAPRYCAADKSAPLKRARAANAVIRVRPGGPGCGRGRSCRPHTLQQRSRLQNVLAPFGTSSSGFHF